MSAKPMRKPKVPGPDVKIDAELLYNAACQQFPSINRWWFSLHTCLVSLFTREEFEQLNLPIAHPKIGKCTMVDHRGTGEKCGEDVDFVLATVFVHPRTQEIVNGRVRGVCAGCLYVNMSKTIVTLTETEFFESQGEDEHGDSDPTTMYLVAERMAFFQENLALVVNELRDKKPETYEKLTKSIMSGETASDW